MVFFKAITICTLIAIVSCNPYQPGYSYAKFSGPVSGPEHEVAFPENHGHGHTLDYVAKPDYHFAYGVEDPKSQVSQSRKETRNGDAVTGEYSLVEPDGTLRIVKYTADKENGFQAQVITNGKPSLHGVNNGGGGGGDHSNQESYHHHGSEDDDDEDY